MDYNELLFAAAVHDLASKLKNGKSSEYWKSLSGSPDQQQRADQWKSENPTLSFVPVALARLQAVAEIIRNEKS